MSGTVTLAEKMRDYEARIAELVKERDRLLSIATKWCDKSHHDWDELLTYDLTSPNEE